MPIFGAAVGWPAQRPAVSPKWPNYLFFRKFTDGKLLRTFPGIALSEAFHIRNRRPRLTIRAMGQAGDGLPVAAA